MSAIASFFLIEASSLDELLKNCWPERIESTKRRFFLFPSTEVEFLDRLPWFLEQHGEELAEFTSTGFIFEDLEGYLNLQDASLFPDFRKREREELERYGYNHVAVYDFDAAKKILSDLGAIHWDPARYREYVDSESTALGDGSGISTKAAFDHFIGWIRVLEVGKVGVFVRA